MPKLKELAIKSVRQVGEITIEGYEIIADGCVIASSNDSKVLNMVSTVKYSIKQLALTGANNGVILKLKISSSDNSTAAGVVSL